MIFTTSVTDLQSAAFSQASYTSRLRVCARFGRQTLTCDHRINGAALYHSATPEQNAVHAFFITHQLSKIKN